MHRISQLQVFRCWESFGTIFGILVFFILHTIPKMDLPTIELGFFCNVMHLHTENCFHFIFLCAFCASIATLLSVVHLALKRWKRNFSRCLFFHIVSQCLKITQYCLIFRFFRIKIQSVDPFSIRFFR